MPRRFWAAIVVAMLALAAVGTLAHGRAPQAATRHGAHRSVVSDTGLDEVTAFAVLPSDEIARQAKIEMKALKAVHYKGFMVLQGDKLALTGGVDEQHHCQLRLGTPGAEMRVRRVSDSYFVHFDRAALTEHPVFLGRSDRVSESLIDAMSGKWWKAPVDSLPEFRGMCGLHSRTSFVGAIVKSLSLTTERGDVARVGGVMAVALVPTQGYGELWVAAVGKHHVVRVTDGAGPESVDIALTGFDRPVKVTAPAYRMLPGFATV